MNKIVKILNRFIQLICVVAALINTQHVWAKTTLVNIQQEHQTKKEDDEGEVSTQLIPATKNAIFEDGAKYVFEVKNTTATDQVGKVSYLVTTETGIKLKHDSIEVKIAKKSTGKYNFFIPETKPGFYKVNFMINVTEYDDTTRKAFGIKPGLLASTHAKPADFDAYWQAAKDELAKVKPQFSVIPAPKYNTSNRYVYAIQMQSIGNITIRGWMTIPKVVDKKKKFAVLLGLPGYQTYLEPMVGLDDDMAIITLNVRGQGNSRDVINTRRDEFIFYHIEDKNKYVMRGVIMDCLRCIDFICSRPELKHDKILASGGSMGGFLAIATSSLDKRVAMCSTQNPILCDIRGLTGKVDWPLIDINKYIAIQPGLTIDKVYNTLDYFDTKNFASNLTCPILMGIGLLDPIAPPGNEYAAFNLIPSKRKRIMPFKDLAHEVNTEYKAYEGRWMRDQFALF
jgi:cephalosporin-C deacetylase-like acetyl esterase